MPVDFGSIPGIGPGGIDPDELSPIAHDPSVMAAIRGASDREPPVAPTRPVSRMEAVRAAANRVDQIEQGIIDATHATALGGTVTLAGERIVVDPLEGVSSGQLVLLTSAINIESNKSTGIAGGPGNIVANMKATRQATGG